MINDGVIKAMLLRAKLLLKRKLYKYSFTPKLSLMSENINFKPILN